MTSFLTQISRSLSCNLPDVVASSDVPCLDISVICSSNNADVIYHVELATYNGQAKLYFLSEIVEEYMRRNSLVEASFSIACDGESLEFDVVYCGLISADLQECEMNFLSPAKSVVVSLSDIHFLSSIFTQEPVRASVVFVEDSGNVLRSDITLAESFADRNSMMFEVAALVELAANDIDAVPNDARAFSISCGQRSKTFYIEQSRKAPDLRLVFRNCFNAPESISLRAYIKAKGSVDSSVAVSGKRRIPYDLYPDVTYEVEASALSVQEVDLLMQALAYKNCLVSCDAGAGNAVFSEIEVISDNNDANLRNAKFSFQFVDIRPMMSALQLAREIVNPYSPFSDQFSREFL